jgi:hypothetical protein
MNGSLARSVLRETSEAKQAQHTRENMSRVRKMAIYPANSLQVEKLFPDIIIISIKFNANIIKSNHFMHQL